MPNINAALGCAQLELLPKIKQVKRRLHDKYKNELTNLSWLRLISENKKSNSNYWLNTIVLRDKLQPTLRELIETCHDQEVFVRPSWRPLHLLPMFNSYPTMDLPTTTDLQDRIINLPSSAC